MGWYGLVDENNPQRAGHDVEKYYNWKMVNIIREFADKDWNDLHVRIQFRRALLVSYEATQMSKREGFAL